MTRALLTLLAGILLAVLLMALIAGERDLWGVIGPVLVTTGLGLAVMAVVAWRARIRHRAEQLDDEHLPTDKNDTTDTTETPRPTSSADRGSDEDTNRG